MRGIREGREDVYLVREKRIRFHRQTYTFCSRYLYEEVAACLQARDTASPQQVPRGRLLGALL